MKLSEIFDQLTHGELSQLSIGNAEVGQIDETNFGAILAHVNLGLAALFKRFPLKEGRLLLELESGRTTYPLTNNYAVSNLDSVEPVRYILDSVDNPYLNDLNKIERVYTDSIFSPYELSINDIDDQYALSTPSLNTLRVPAAIVECSVDLPDQLRTSTLEVVYRANHPILTLNNETYNPEWVEVDLPYSHLQALLYFIGSRVYNPMGMTNEFNAGNNYNAKYEQECQRLEGVGLTINQGSHSTKLVRNGWV